MNISVTSIVSDFFGCGSSYNLSLFVFTPFTVPEFVLFFDVYYFVKVVFWNW